VLISELEGLNETEDLINGATDGKIVDGDLADGTLGVDDEETTESNTSFLDKDTVVLGNGLGLIGEERDLHLTKTTLLARSVDPGKVREFYGNPENFFF
jgi:hypothetical protein